jgi:hypothetical protein
MTGIRIVKALIAAGFAAALALASACGSDPEEETGCKAGACPFDYASWDGTLPVSFETEVFPIFRRACGLSSSCHGSKLKPLAGLYIGPKRSDTTTVVDAAFRQMIIDDYLVQPSKTAPELKRVEPSQPEKSFLMIKLDHCQSSSGLACTKQTGSKVDDPCGGGMPQTSSSLCPDELDLIRRWIKQGAQNN